MKGLVTVLVILMVAALVTDVRANPDAKRLYDDLLSHYNRLIRPVSNNSEVVTVRLGLHLSQLIDLVSFYNSVCCPAPQKLGLKVCPPIRINLVLCVHVWSSSFDVCGLWKATTSICPRLA